MPLGPVFGLRSRVRPSSAFDERGGGGAHEGALVRLQAVRFIDTTGYWQEMACLVSHAWELQQDFHVFRLPKADI